jgi:DNA-binding IclR family transcriptional regulator
VAQRSQPAERVVRVLETLRASSDEGLRFAEVARSAGVSQATCHAILTTLADAGYVQREPATKTYSLGPALVGLAAGAARSLRSARLTQPVLDDLAQRTGLACSAAEAVGDSITIVAVAVPPGREPTVHFGARVPFAPPFGAIHVAWSAVPDVDAWVERATSAAGAPDRLREIVRDHRRTGVAVAPSTPASAPLREALAALATDPNAGEVRDRTIELLATIDRLDYSAAELSDGDVLSVNTVTAPVFDADERVAFAVALHLAEPDVPVTRLRGLIDELRNTTHTMTVLIGGHAPGDHARPATRAGSERTTSERTSGAA